MRGVRVGNLGGRQGHEQEEEGTHELARDANGMELELSDDTGSHVGGRMLFKR